MGNSKIVYYGETLIDLTGDTVEAAKLLKGVTAHDKKGEKITGILADVTQATPAITVDAAGKITASATQAAGVVAAGTKSATKRLTVQAAKTVIPSASAQTAVAKGVFTTGIVTVAAVYAVISVTYPSGSTCTCTNGSKILTAKDTTGKALFVIPAAGTWTVKAVSGSKSTSKTASITAEGQSVSVTLSYGLFLFDGGDKTGVTGGWTYTITRDDYGGSPVRGDNLTVGTTLYWLPGRSWNGGGTDQKNKNGYAHTKNKIDVTNYNTITAVSNYAEGHLTVGNASVALKVGTVSLDISALTGSYEVRLGDTVSGDTCSEVEISKLYLS